MSARTLRITLTVFTLAGLGIASYLTYVHYAGIKPVCTAGGSCEKVQTSVYSELAGVPVALLGLLIYMAVFGLLLGPENESTRFAMMALTLVGFAFSAYLTYRELFSIHAICEWCASSAAILTLMAPLSVWRFLRGAPSRPVIGPGQRSVESRGQSVVLSNNL
ncbi:MAG TPA: vitamin K epoxide reductase family protein [Solirubrobacteraceae bacterium]|nr:vitamin K epoxide reductase family protein [Solirubrobacteraceae bacterium]